MKYLGQATKILNMEIQRDKVRGKIDLIQKQYLKNILQQFGIHEQSKPIGMPLTFHFNLSASLSLNI